MMKNCCRLERHIDTGVLDKFAAAEIKSRIDEGRAVPTIQDIYYFKRNEAYKIFEERAEDEGEKERMMDSLLEMYGSSVSETRLQRFYDQVSGIQKAVSGEQDNMHIEDRISWINNYAIGVHSKIKYLEELLKTLPSYVDTKYRVKITGMITAYNNQLEMEKQRRERDGKMKDQYKDEVLPPWKCIQIAMKRGLLDKNSWRAFQMNTTTE